MSSKDFPIADELQDDHDLSTCERVQGTVIKWAQVWIVAYLSDKHRCCFKICTHFTPLEDI